MSTASQANVPYPHPDAPPPAGTGRDAQGRFAKGNPGGPGNPYYRRQAHLKRLMLEAVTDDDVRSVMQVLLGLARSGDLAAIKLYLQYAVGQPSKEVDPDQADLHEWRLHRQTPRLPQVGELMAQGIETGEANRVARAVVPIVGACHLQTLSQHLRSGTDLDGTQLAPPLEEVQPAAVHNGGKRNSMSARRMAARVHTADPTADNGTDEERVWNEMFDEETRDAEPTGDIGAIAAMLRTLPDGGKEVLDRIARAGRLPD